MMAKKHWLDHCNDSIVRWCVYTSSKRWLVYKVITPTLWLDSWTGGWNVYGLVREGEYLCSYQTSFEVHANAKRNSTNNRWVYVLHNNCFAPIHFLARGMMVFSSELFLRGFIGRTILIVNRGVTMQHLLYYIYGFTTNPIGDKGYITYICE